MTIQPAPNDRCGATFESRSIEDKFPTYVCIRFAGHRSEHVAWNGSWTDSDHWIDAEVEDSIREAAQRPLVEALEPLRRFLELTVTDRHVAHFHERDGISLNLSYAEWRAIARALISPASEDTND